MSSRHLRRAKEQLQTPSDKVEEEEEEEEDQEEGAAAAKPFNPFDLLSDDDTVRGWEGRREGGKGAHAGGTMRV